MAFEGKYIRDKESDEFYYVIKIIYGDGLFYVKDNSKKQYLKNVAFLLPYRNYIPNEDCMIYECENDDNLCEDVCRIIEMELLDDFAISIAKNSDPGKKNLNKRMYSNVKAEYVDQDEWNMEFKPKARKVLQEEILIIQNLKDILPLWECKSSRFNIQSDTLIYIMNEIQRQFRADNFEVRNILATALEFFPKLCILNFFQHWPFKLKPEEYLILRDTKYKKPLINKAIDFLMIKENWLNEDYDSDKECDKLLDKLCEQSDDEVVIIEEIEVMNEM
jgi:hypothetical protein